MPKAKWNKAKRGVATWAHFENKLEEYKEASLRRNITSVSPPPETKNMKQMKSQKDWMFGDRKEKRSDNAVLKNELLKRIYLKGIMGVSRKEIRRGKQWSKGNEGFVKSKTISELNKGDVEGEIEETVKGTEREVGSGAGTVGHGKAEDFKSIAKEGEEQVIHSKGLKEPQSIENKLQIGLLRGSNVGLVGETRKGVEPREEDPLSKREMAVMVKRSDSEDGKYEQRDISTNTPYLKRSVEKSAEKEIRSKSMKNLSIQKGKSRIHIKSGQEPILFKATKEKTITQENIKEATCKNESNMCRRSEEMVKLLKTEERPLQIEKVKEKCKKTEEVEARLGTDFEESVRESELLLDSMLKEFLRTKLSLESEIEEGKRLVKRHIDILNSGILSVQGGFVLKEMGDAGEGKARFEKDHSISHCKFTESKKMFENTSEKAEEVTEESVITKKLDMLSLEKNCEEGSRSTRNEEELIDVHEKERVKSKEDGSGFDVQKKEKSEYYMEIENGQGKKSGHMKSLVEHGVGTLFANSTEEAILQVDKDINVSAYKTKMVGAVDNEAQIFEVESAVKDDVQVIAAVEQCLGSDQVEPENMEETVKEKSFAFNELDENEYKMVPKPMKMHIEEETKMRIALDEVEQGYLEVIERDLCMNIKDPLDGLQVKKHSEDVQKKFEEAINSMGKDENSHSEELDMVNTSEDFSDLSISKST
ncbi:uncharacterized protein LOC143024834 [Oratosquilla oratoria]|uniref:uncharacterized protein LOC143024834 n=1 Tax=Oratosquilla oratoria TaxID=337810 RepID=UPI003F75F884